MTNLDPPNNPQKSTKLQYSRLDWQKQRWIDVSLLLKTRNKSIISAKCAELYGGTESTWRTYFYRWDNRKEFEEFWLDLYLRTQTRELKLATHDRAIELVEKERDLAKVTNLLEVVSNENKGAQTTVAVQFNNIVNKEKEEFGI